MKTRISLILSLAVLLPALAAAQCECCVKREAGRKLYDQGKYEQAIAKWKEGQKSNDAEDCADLEQLIAKADAKIKQRDQAAAQRQSQNAELKRVRDKADDDLWDALKDGDAADCDKYLAKYPLKAPGRHTKEANDRKKALSAPPPVAPGDKMAFVAGGTFQMGDVLGDDYLNNETVHSVTVSSFYLSKTEVTFDEFDAFCSATGHAKPEDDFGWGRGKRPVINVDWYDAVEYCNWLSQQQKLTLVYSIDKSVQDPNNQSGTDTKKWKVTVNWSANGYRLPTEAEWEYAARALGGKGGGKVRFGNGRDTINPAEINFDASSAGFKQSYSITGDHLGKTVPADELSANCLGLKNMSGNVWEWCWDWYDTAYYGQSDGAKNPTGPASGQYRVIRGGSYFSVPKNCRSAQRYERIAFNVSYDMGFRVARGYKP